MDPHQQRDPGGRLDPRGTPLGHSPAGGQTPQQVDGDIQDVGSQPAANRQPQYLGGFTMIPPNQSRRSEMQAVAQKGEQDYQRLKESQRPSAVHLNPERLGGHVTLAEARQKQLTDARSAKLQKKLKKEEAEKKKKQEEEEELQRMKAKQREKAERLEEKKRQDEQRRREQFLEDQTRRTESFLQRFERRAADLPSSAAHTSSKSEDATSEKRGKESKSVRELEQERKRVNMAFLDKLEGQSRRTEKEENIQEAGHSFLEPHNFRQQTTQQSPVTHLKPDEEDSFSGLTSETEPDYDWALMKLMTSFPDCAKCFLEDILTQCDGDYEKAHSLLICTLS
ncbi:unnamed protein product [Menidia menidia]|uniref:(Atlantic silverside) hypothetical protein n=1 Tax=Menidia menidia TaxID=238744 RepID=A0A8S4A9U7_9TELE|nr:unnamed protein product [Menidia menidia]